MKILIFGASSGGQEYLHKIEKKGSDITILAFADNNPELVGTCYVGIPVIAPEEIVNYSYDKIVIATMMEYTYKIFEQLRSLGIPEIKIESAIYSDLDFLSYDAKSDNRVSWLRDFSHHVYSHNIPGNVAECGVFRGHFARYINSYFKDRTLYLFDTFDGFPEYVYDLETRRSGGTFYTSFWTQQNDNFKSSDPAWVLRSMPRAENCIIKNGDFIEASSDVEDSFCFVNLDMDFYKPTIDALNFFWNKMTPGGIILIHDYGFECTAGIAQAVAEFEKTLKTSLCKTPIGDSCSIAIIKN